MEELSEEKNKFNNVRCILHSSGVIEKVKLTEITRRKKNGLIPLDAIVFDSLKEAEYYRDQLLPYVKQGAITVEIQPKYLLLEGFTKMGKKYQPMTYSPDFRVTTVKTGGVFCVDVKGFENDRFPLKKKLWDSQNPDTILYVMKWVKKFGGWLEVEKYNELKAKERKRDKELGIVKPKRTMRRTKG